jgi:hypothetical protein
MPKVVTLFINYINDDIYSRNDPALPYRNAFQVSTDAVIGSVYKVY